jgi:hypothetical protein
MRSPADQALPELTIRRNVVYIRFMRSPLVAVLVFSTLLSSCRSDKSPAKSAADCTKMGAKTGVEGAKTGVKTGVEGVKTAGSAVGGLFSGGSDEAKRKWKEGKAETKRTANEGAAETTRTSRDPDCP